MKKIDSKQLLLYMLYLGFDNQENVPIDGTTRIQKMFFIFEKEILPCLKNKTYDSPAFFAYNYGPYSKDISENIRFFHNIKFIDETVLDYDKPQKAVEEEIYDESDWLFDDINSVNENESIKEYSYFLTQIGLKYVKENLLNLYDSEDKKLLQQFKKKICSMPLSGIIDYVYHKYEDMTEKSLIRDKVLGEKQ